MNSLFLENLNFYDKLNEQLDKEIYNEKHAQKDLPNALKDETYLKIYD